ncbi:MAG: hypothetical protein ACFE68_04955 [Candidatus Hodarchaeota archaeon]
MEIKPEIIAKNPLATARYQPKPISTLVRSIQSEISSVYSDNAPIKAIRPPKNVPITLILVCDRYLRLVSKGVPTIANSTTRPPKNTKIPPVLKGLSKPSFSNIAHSTHGKKGESNNKKPLKIPISLLISSILTKPPINQK